VKRFLLPLVLIGVLEVVVEAEESTLSERYRTLMAEYQAAKQSYLADRAAVATSAERRQAEGRRPKAEDFARRFLELAKTDVADAAAFEALAWITTYSPRSPQADEAMKLLGKHQVADKRLGSVLQNLGSLRSPAAEKLLRAALESSPHREVRAQACYSLATLLMAKGGVATGAKGPQNAGVQNPTQDSDGSTKQSIDPTRDEVVKLFERMADEFGDVKVVSRKTYRDVARANLARLRPKSAEKVDSGPVPINLEIGMVAPEIEGRDTKNRPMRLSRYRGKVVVLDFWGHW
jgi:hypothetical protein